MDPLTIGGLGVGLIGGLGNIFGGRKRRKEMDELLQRDARYTESPIAREQYGYAKSLLNARMPGSATIENNIYGAQANQMANINRLATDSSQALALASGAQAQTNESFQNLGVQQSQDYYNRLQNLNQAQQGMISEGDKVYQDMVRRWENRAGVTSANSQNRANTWNSLSNLGFGVMNLGLSGGAKGLFGGGGNAATTTAAATERNLPYSNYKVPLATY
jgi:hypothetical protein